MKHSVILSAFFYIVFSFGCKSFDPMKWSVEAIYCCGGLIFIAYIVPLMFITLEGHNEKK